MTHNAHLNMHCTLALAFLQSVNMLDYETCKFQTTKFYVTAGPYFEKTLSLDDPSFIAESTGTSSVAL